MKKENSKRTGTIILFLVLALLLIFIIFIKNTGKSNEGEDYQQQLELYLEAAKESPQKSSEYAYFPNDDLRLAHEQSNMRLISYEIESSTKINDKLYEYNVLIKTDFAPEEYTRVYYFVGNIDGELKFIVNLGIVTLLRGLREQGLVSGSEAKKIAARLMVQLGADIIISL